MAADPFSSFRCHLRACRGRNGRALRRVVASEIHLQVLFQFLHCRLGADKIHGFASGDGSWYKVTRPRVNVDELLRCQVQSTSCNSVELRVVTM